MGLHMRTSDKITQCDAEKYSFSLLHFERSSKLSIFLHHCLN